ncbi:MAG: polysaccharide pyruvyl transferase family protein [Clostridia bacterium]|nr:polysaccharide pyruvyl transferase family protein [Clostridia bacterium]
MKNVKILTFHNAENYGANLQAYALKELLKDMDTTPSFINYQDKHILKDYKLIKTNSLKSFFSSLWYMPRNLKRKKSFKSFCDAHLDGNTKKYYRIENIEKDITNEDILVAGSDQIFNPELTGGLSEIYTLNFKKENTKKIIYGASVGNDELLEINKDDFKEKLKELEFISVREENVAKSLERILNKKVEKVLDPTLLLEKEKWEEILTKEKTLNLDNTKYILVYTLFEDPEITKITDYLSCKTGLKVIHFRKYNAYKNQLMSMYTKGPADFINAFKNAEYIVTNSFHGLVFSIIFERKQYVIMPKSRGGRLKDLISLTGLEKRAVNSLEDVVGKELDEEIDYVSVKNKLNYEKEKSIEYLRGGICKT